jgi:hypothetical protein
MAPGETQIRGRCGDGERCGGPRSELRRLVICRCRGLSGTGWSAANLFGIGSSRHHRRVCPRHGSRGSRACGGSWGLSSLVLRVSFLVLRRRALGVRGCDADGAGGAEVVAPARRPRQRYAACRTRPRPEWHHRGPRVG